MKHKCSITLVLLVAALMALPTKLSAQTYEYEDANGVYRVEYVPYSKEESKVTKKSDYTGQGEFRIGLGHNPYTPSGYASVVYWKDYPVMLPPNTTVNNTRWFTTNLDMGGWLKRWCYIGAVASWTMGYERVSNKIDHSRVDAFNYNNITFMPVIRFAWVNRGIVQLYSGLGLGATYEFYENTLTSEIQRFGVAYDVTFFGITVGRNWFGYLDIGAGNRGVISAGFGCRFNKKY
jgi:hypothetical protein